MLQNTFILTVRLTSEESGYLSPADVVLSSRWPMLLFLPALLTAWWCRLVPAQPGTPPRPAYTPLDTVRAYTFYATPALYRQLADTLARQPKHFIYPGGHAYVLGYVRQRRWYVVSFTLGANEPWYYLRYDELQEIQPYRPPADSGWGQRK